MRSIPDPGFADDDGGADPVVAAALAAYDRAGRADQSAAHLQALSVLQDSRVLVPVVAILEEMEEAAIPDGGAGTGLPREKSSDMAAVLMTGRDGRTALLAFTSTATLNRWAQTYAGGEPRLVPVPARQAASAALQDRAAALLLDVAGPVLFVLEGEDLESLAAGHRLVRLKDQWAWVQDQ
jgi:SseB protein N-terminal domain